MISRFCHYIWKRTTRTNTQSQRIIRMSLFDCPATQNKLCLGYFILDNFEIPLKGMAYFFFICFLCFYPPSLMTDSQNHLYCFNSWLFKIMSNCSDLCPFGTRLKLIHIMFTLLTGYLYRFLFLILKYLISWYFVCYWYVILYNCYNIETWLIFHCYKK